MTQVNLNITFRDTVNAADPETIEELTTSCNIFYPEEIAVARELVEDRLLKGISCGYYFFFAEVDGRIAGYTCFGPIPMTRSRFDIYWIAVFKAFQGTGIGRLLMQKTEDQVQAMNGRRIYVETSSRNEYSPAHRFYSASGYHPDAVLKDYYAPGDSKLVYLKILTEDTCDI